MVTLLEESVKYHPEAFLFVSTDKAAQVSGVYGATKLIGEVLIHEVARINPETKYRVVRYGNILHSTGSVICKWKSQLERGERVTVTDLDATRFYWTVEQAVDLIFNCLDEATDSRPYVPAMKSMRLGDLLAAMHEKYGRGLLQYDVVGLQPGENLHELSMKDCPNSFEVERYTKEEILELL